MNYPKTIDILWGRLLGGLTGEDYSAWATGLMVDGIENPDIIHLASNPDLHWQELEVTVQKVMNGLDQKVPDKMEDLCRVIQTRMIERYNDGEIDEIELVTQCHKLWWKSDYCHAFRIWGDLDEDISMCETEHGPIFYPIDPKDIKRSLRKVLINEGVLAQQADAPNRAAPGNR